MIMYGFKTTINNIKKKKKLPSESVFEARFV